MRTVGRMGLVLLLILIVALGLVLAIRSLAARSYGPPAESLNPIQVTQYSARLLWADGLLTRPLDAQGPETTFDVQVGESVDSVSSRLERAGIVVAGAVLKDYLVYTGLDMSLQAGSYRLSPRMSIIQIAREMQDATPSEVEFVVLAGWRIEEIASTLPTSGLSIGPQEFVQAAYSPHAGYDFLEGARTLEGYLYPDHYVLPRDIGVSTLLDTMVQRFTQNLNGGLREKIALQDLNVAEAVTLASIVQREAVIPEEAPLIASVYLNRLRAGMRLDADPSVQYALGFNAAQQTWWTNPLSLDNLKVDSAYNTYETNGLPPGPIANPGDTALLAVAEPSVSGYYYFNARCDGSGFHTFSESFSEHLNSLCQ